MRTRLHLLALLLFSIPCTLISQEDFNCDFVPITAIDQASVTFNEMQLGPDDDRPYVFKVHYWQINEDDGSNEDPKGEEDFMDSLAMLNQIFNEFNIFFKWDGFTYLNSSLYYDWDRTGVSTFAFYNNYILPNALYVPKSFNIYVAKNLAEFVGGAGQQGDILPVRMLSTAINDPRLAHEVGHNLGLSHTFGGFGPTDNQTDPNVCEHVTRDVTHPDFNAFVKGDGLYWTNATPYSMFYEDVELDSNCNYIGSAVDCNGELYVDPEFKNIMSYTRLDCYREFKTYTSG